MRSLVAGITLVLMSAVANADIAIGVAGPMTGQNAQFGEQMLQGAQAAVDRINQDGGINGEQVTIVSADDGCDARRAAAAAQGFVSKDVRFVVGHFCSGASIAAADVYAKADIILMSPTASNPKLTEGRQWNIFRLAARDDAQAKAAFARIAQERPNQKIAVVTDGTPGMDALVDAFQGTSAPVVIKPGQQAFPEAVSAIQASGATVVYFACQGAEAGRLAAQLQDAGVDFKAYGPDTLLVDGFWEMAGSAGEGALVTFAADPVQSPKAQSLVAFMTAAGLSTEGATLPSYAAVQAFAAAAKSSSVNDGRAMAAKLKSGTPVDTVLGSVVFDSKGDVTPPRLDWYRWSQGSYAREPQNN